MSDTTTYTYPIVLHAVAWIDGMIEGECRNTISRDLRQIVAEGEEATSDNGARLRFTGFSVGERGADPVLPVLDDCAAFAAGFDGCEHNGETVETLLSRVERARAAYLSMIGYDPFADDPTITVDEVEQTLAEHAEATGEAEAAGAPVLDDGKKHHRCPECGDREHLYGKIDTRWDFARQEWIGCPDEGTIECTNCDWSGEIAATIYTGEGEVS